MLLDYSVIGQNSTRIVFRFNGWWNVTCAITQGSTKNPWLFNIFENDMFLCVSGADICNFAENNILCGKVLCDASRNLKFDPGRALQW